MSHINYQQVNSSAITQIGYDANNEALYVNLKNTGEYRYDNVPQNVYNDFMNSESKGSYFTQNIKSKYTGGRVNN